MREKKSIRERFIQPLKSVGTVLLFFAALLMLFWATIVIVRFILGAS